MMLSRLLLTFSFLFFLCCEKISAQTQEEFNDKMTEVYSAGGDKDKAFTSAKEMYAMLEKSKELQTYSNYLVMKMIFETQTSDTQYAKLCQERADQLLKEMTGGANTANANNPNPDANSKWLNEYFPALFSTTDPQNANKASKFLAQNPSLQSFINFTYVGYAYERNGDFIKAKEYYEKALPLAGDDKATFNTYAYYTNFLSSSGEYLKAEEYIKKMEWLSTVAPEYYKESYKAEALTSKLVYYLAIGDFYSYILASQEQYAFFSKKYHGTAGVKCDPFPSTQFTYMAYANEMLHNYKETEQYWQKRDSSHYVWVACHNKEYPTNKQYPLAMLPVYQIKIGKQKEISKPIDFYIKETETHYNSYSAYADLSINFMRAEHLGFLGAPQYHELYKKIMELIISTKDYRASTLPFSSYAYFTMRDRKLDVSKHTYDQLFKLNEAWINDVIFSFGEKAFVTYYNAKLKEGYDNYHSFVKLAKENGSSLYPALSAQAYNNILFTKSLSLKGTQKRKEAFLNANDPTIKALYEEWLLKKQELIRQYRKGENAQGAGTADKEKTQELQEEVNHLENELTQKAKDFKKYLKISAPDWKTVRDQLQEGEAAIEIVRFQWRDKVYYSDSSYYAAYIITKGCTAPEVVYLPDFAKDLDGKYYKLYQNKIRMKAVDKESYQHYWKPIQVHLKGVKRVYFSADGIYHLINMSTLFNPETEKYLLDEIEIQSLISTSDILGAIEIGKPIQTAVLIGRPSYSLTLTNTIAYHTPNTTRAFVSGFRDNTIADLPGTEQEVTSIQKEMTKYSVQVTLFLKEHATEDQIYKLNSPDILHIATHGYWSSAGNESTDGYRTFNAMVNSGLLMAGVVNFYQSEVYPDTYDGIITAYEAQNINLENTSLVILSACETSLGHFDAGEGVYGLQRAFRSAGAKSIMTSLWKVDDQATRDFMILFYEEYLKTKDKSKAFRHAQQTLKLKYPQPYYWGAFVLSGK